MLVVVLLRFPLFVIICRDKCRQMSVFAALVSAKLAVVAAVVVIVLDKHIRLKS